MEHFVVLCSLSQETAGQLSGRMDRASATETVDLGSIPDRVKPKTINMAFSAFLLDIQHKKGTA